MELMEVKEILDKKLVRIREINLQIQDELLKPGNITNSQQKQILKLKQERYKIRASYYEKMKELTNNNYVRQKCDKVIKDCKDTECRTYYLCQSKKR